MALSIISRLSSNLNVGAALSASAVSRRTSGAEPLRMSALQNFHGNTNGVIRSIAGLRESLLDGGGSRRGLVVTSGRVSETVAVETEIEHEGTYTSLSSAAPVSALFRGYETPRVFWEDSSSSRVRVYGVYEGEEDDTLTFTVEEDVDGQYLSATNLAGDDLGAYAVTSEANNALTLENGVELTIRSGSIVTGDTFSLDVLGQDAEAENDGELQGNLRNHLVFEDNDTISSGSFHINDVSISVGYSDTINTVLGKINSSEAGVTASYDSETDTVSLSQKTEGAWEIALGEDSSGFLAAMNLDASAEVMGVDAWTEVQVDYEQQSTVPIQAGDFFINDVEITVDAGDSLQDVLDAINASDARVYARLNASSGELQIHSSSRGGVKLVDGTSGFLSSVGLREGEHKRERGGFSSSALRRVMNNLREVEEQVAVLYQEVGGEKYASVELDGMRDRINKVMGAALSGGSNGERKIAETIFGDAGGEDFFDLLGGEKSALKDGLRSGDEDLMTFLLGEEKDGNGGLLCSLMTELSDVGQSLGCESGSRGLIINISI